jgi:hypothetical protein
MSESSTGPARLNGSAMGRAATLGPSRPKSPGWAHTGLVKSPRPARRRHLPTSPFKAPPAPPPVKEFELDDQVTHDTYGLGRVVEIEPGRAVLVDFGAQKIRILTPYPKLFKL